MHLAVLMLLAATVREFEAAAQLPSPTLSLFWLRLNSPSDIFLGSGGFPGRLDQSTKLFLFLRLKKGG